MQRPNPIKRARIVEAAAELFARRPFHEVRLEEIAADARVGKGTLYVYFKSKEELFDALLVEGFDRLLTETRGIADQGTAWEALTRVVRAMVEWAVRSPHFYQLIRSSTEQPAIPPRTPRLKERRRELGLLIQRILVRGVRSGEFADPDPALTAQFIPSCVRGALRFGPAHPDIDHVTSHILRIIGGGIRRHSRQPAPRRRANRPPALSRA